ncbi:MAG TPA: FAD-binding oxidoreductase [Pseudomonadales bacterium]
MAVWNQPRSFWTWGNVSDEPSQAEREKMARSVSQRLGREVLPPPIPDLDRVEIRPARVSVPGNLTGFVSTSHRDRALHTYGGHSLELLKALRGQFDNPPDAVAYPGDEDQLEAVLTWCDRQGYVAIPYGGATTVVWGVNVPVDCKAAVSIDLRGFHRVLEVDEVSRAAHIEGGVFGPDLEDHLRPLGLTLRHFPQSFPWSTVGGWVATRSGGHYATNHTHIDDFVESVRMLAPRGWWESRRLPGSGAGPSPDRLAIGSEGILGVITSVWLRLQKRPVYRATAGVVFPSWSAGSEAARHIVQAKLWPANLRLLDPVEAQASAGLDGEQALLIIGFESADVPQGPNVQAAVRIARECGGQIDDDAVRIDDGSGQATGREGAVGAWRQSFIGVNAGVSNGLGLLADTFETAITWDRWPAFDAHVRDRVGKALKEALGEGTRLSCRFTHVYPDGPAPYYSFSGMAPIGGEAEAWQHIKDTATRAVVEAGGTCTHHHAVGRMHRPGYEQQVPALFQASLRAVKKTLDPSGILNPGVLIDP